MGRMRQSCPRWSPPSPSGAAYLEAYPRKSLEERRGAYRTTSIRGRSFVAGGCRGQLSRQGLASPTAFTKEASPQDICLILAVFISRAPIGRPSGCSRARQALLFRPTTSQPLLRPTSVACRQHPRNWQGDRDAGEQTTHVLARLPASRACHVRHAHHRRSPTFAVACRPCAIPSRTRYIVAVPLHTLACRGAMASAARIAFVCLSMYILFPGTHESLES